MRRLVGILALLGLLGVGLVVSACGGAGGGDAGAYRVRAVFNNAFALTKDTEVRVAGARVGTVEKLDVDQNRKAVVTLNITDPGFQDFRQDANCIIRPQSLIGERFVECRVTQPRTNGGSKPPPQLREIEVDGQKQRLLPVQNTSSPIDLDLVFNINRLPQAQRLQIILAELGTGVAGRSTEIRQAVRNAAPALQDTDRVLKLLAEQNGALRRLATDGDTSLRPIARERRRLTRFVTEAGNVARATSERRADLETNIRLLPGTLAEIRPTMRELERLSDQATPALADIRASARPTRQLLASLQPFSRAAVGPVKDLGDTSDVARRTLRNSRPTIRRLETLGARLQPLSSDLRQTLDSAEENGVFEGFADFVYFQAMAVNGFDSAGHYLRAHLLAENTSCSIFAITENSCSANFNPDVAAGEAAAERNARTVKSDDAGSASPPSYDERQDPKLVLLEQVSKGKSIERVLDEFQDEPRFVKVVKGMRERLEEIEERQANDKKGASASGRRGGAGATDGPAIKPPSDLLPGDQGSSRSRSADRGNRAAASAAGGGDQAAAADSAAQDGMLDYLLGGGS